MRHQPHLYVPGPWAPDELKTGPDHVKHLDRVLRYPIGDPVSYTDGTGTIGHGTWTGDGVIRGDEVSVALNPPNLTMAVAPPKSKERQRFIVEKLQEMSVRRLVWINTERSQVRPRPDRSESWAASALEQSRGAWLMHVAVAEYPELQNPFVADVAGMPLAEGGRWVGDVTIAVGPEGGFTETEIAMFSNHVALGSGVLRTETAAISLAAVVLFGAS